MKLSLGGCSEVIYVVKVQVGASKGGCYSQAGGHYLEIRNCKWTKDVLNKRTI